MAGESAIVAPTPVMYDLVVLATEATRTYDIAAAITALRGADVDKLPADDPDSVAMGEAIARLVRAAERWGRRHVDLAVVPGQEMRS